MVGGFAPLCVLAYRAPRHERVTLLRHSRFSRVLFETSWRIYESVRTTVADDVAFCRSLSKKGPLERAGKAVDSAVQDTKKSGEAAGKKVDDAVDDVSDGVKDAADDLKKN